MLRPLHRAAQQPEQRAQAAIDRPQAHRIHQLLGEPRQQPAGEPHGRPRIKVVDRETMVEVSRAVAQAKARTGESRTRSRSSTKDISSGRRGGQRSGTNRQKFVCYPISKPHLDDGRALINWICDLHMGDQAMLPREDWNRPGKLADFIASSLATIATPVTTPNGATPKRKGSAAFAPAAASLRSAVSRMRSISRFSRAA